MESIPITYKTIIQQLDIDTGEVLNCFSNLQQAAKLTQINPSTISKVMSPRFPQRKSAGGYFWKKVQVLLEYFPEKDSFCYNNSQ